jgi:hypothetical protein
MIEDALITDESAIDAKVFIRCWPERGSQPVQVVGSDQKQYIVKGLISGRDRGRAIAIEHVVDTLGSFIGAPVPPSVLINLPHELILQHAEMAHLRYGTAHGTVWVEGCNDARHPREIPCVDEPNRYRLASIAVLYGWLVDSDVLGDFQLIYERQSPYRIYTVDHDVFWESIPLWEDVRSSLMKPDPVLGIVWEPGPAEPNFRILKFLAGDRYIKEVPEVHEAVAKLQHVSKDDIAQAVASPSVEWGLTLESRAELAEYLESRRLQLLNWSSKR